MLKIEPIPALRDNYIWLLRDSSQAQATIVDPGESEPVVAYLTANGLELSTILITHHHWDHTAGISDLIKKYKNVTICGSRKTMGEEIINYSVTDKQQLTLKSPEITFEALSIPGHTLDHTAYYHPGILFSGDTLFTGGCGRLFEGSAEQMLTSLEKLKSLPEDTNIYCGHEYTLANLQFAQAVEPENEAITKRLVEVKALREKQLPTVPSTLSIELETNPFLRTFVPAVKQAAEKFSQKPLGNSVEVFAAIRQWKNQFKLH